MLAIRNIVTVDQLASYIARHDGCKLVGRDRIVGTIYVESEYVDNAGNVGRQVDEIPENLQAVRDWLGY